MGCLATYKTHTKLDIKLDSSQMGGQMHDQMMAMLKKQFEKTYKLTFNKEESIYKEYTISTWTNKIFNL